MHHFLIMVATAVLTMACALKLALALAYFLVPEFPLLMEILRDTLRRTTDCHLQKTAFRDINYFPTCTRPVL